MLSLGIEIAFAILLVTTIGYAIILNRKLGSLQQHKEELERLATTFSQSTIRAEKGVQRLKTCTAEMQKSIVKAETLRDDLALMIDRGSLTADRLGEGVRSIRTRTNETNITAQEKMLEPNSSLSDQASDQGGVFGNGQKEGKKKNKNNRRESLEKQKAQAERDLIEALRQAR